MCRLKQHLIFFFILLYFLSIIVNECKPSMKNVEKLKRTIISFPPKTCLDSSYIPFTIKILQCGIIHNLQMQKEISTHHFRILN